MMENYRFLEGNICKISDGLLKFSYLGWFGRIYEEVL